MKTWSHVTVGVADMEQALELWQNVFGLEPAAEKFGPDAVLAKRWSIAADDIARQVVLRTPSQQSGMLHLVEFVDPDPSVRAGAEVFDRVPKNLDVHVDDLPAKVAALKAAGFKFRTDNFSTVQAPNGDTFREIHLPAHDDTNIVLLEVLGEQLPHTKQGFAGIGLVITIVHDVETEKRFYLQALGLQITAENQLDGPEVERMVGLPAGSALNIAILGEQDEHFGLMELIAYRGVAGRNLYPRAKPKATGLLMVHYQVEDLRSWETHWRHCRLDYQQHEAAETLLNSGHSTSLTTPAGFRIEVHQG